MLGFVLSRGNWVTVTLTEERIVGGSWARNRRGVFEEGEKGLRVVESWVRKRVRMLDVFVVCDLEMTGRALRFGMGEK